MSSIMGTVAARVVSTLKDAGFTGAVLDYCPDLALADGNHNVLLVSPAGYAIALDQSRSKSARIVKVGIMYMVGPVTAADFATHNENVEKMSDLFYLKPLPNMANVSCISFEANPVGSPARLRETHQYLANIEMEFLTL